MAPLWPRRNRWNVRGLWKENGVEDHICSQPPLTAGDSHPLRGDPSPGGPGAPAPCDRVTWPPSKPQFQAVASGDRQESAVRPLAAPPHAVCTACSSSEPNGGRRAGPGHEHATRAVGPEDLGSRGAPERSKGQGPRRRTSQPLGLCGHSVQPNERLSVEARPERGANSPRVCASV